MKNNKSALNRLLKYTKPHILLLILGTIASFVLCSIGIVVPYIISTLTEAAINNQVDIFIKYIYYAVIAILVGFVFSYLSHYLTNIYNATFVRNIKNSLSSHIQKLPVSTVSSYHSGDMVSRINNDVMVASNFLGSIPISICQPFLFLGAGAFASMISWKLLAASGILMPISSFIFNIINKPIGKYSRELMEETAESNSILQDVISGIPIIKAFNMKERMSNKYNQIALNIQNKNIKIDVVNAKVTPAFLSMRLIPMLVVPIYGGYLAYTGEITLGNLLAFGMLANLLFQPIEAIMRFVSGMRETNPAAARIFEILDEAAEESGNITEINKADNSIFEFDKVSFSYNNDNNVLEDISFKVPVNKTTALVGSSGSGKSTILKLICGFYKNQRGQIKLHGTDIKEIDIKTLRNQISIISQEVYLFPTTIIKNISYGKPDAAREEIIKAAKLANAHDFIMEQPNGYETIVGERGSKLSGGQQQRIALARALLKNAPILLLDEPTSALDTQAEAAVQEGLKRLMEGRTVIVVAHRLSTIKSADQIIVIDEKKVAEYGTHDQLLSKDGIYKKLYNKNFTEQESSNNNPSKQGGMKYA